MKIEKIKLGNVYRDLVHGFIGIATVATKHLTGCNRVLLEKLVNDDIKENWFDVASLELVENPEEVRPSKIKKDVNFIDIGLGKEGVDTVTKFKGIVISHTVNLIGEDRVGLQTMNKNADVSTLWIDLSNLESDYLKAQKRFEMPKNTGGPGKVEPQRNY